jgi:PAS domain S-box-containing protein
MANACAISIGIDMNGHILEWNSAAEAMSGFGRDELLGLDFVNGLLGTTCRMRASDAIHKARAGEKLTRLELPFYSKSGRKMDLTLSMSLRPCDIIFLGGCMTTPETHLPKKHKHAVAKISVDANGIITGWDTEAANLLGFTRAEMHGLQFVDDILTAEVRAFAEQKIAHALNCQNVPSFELPIYSKSGWLKYINVKIDPQYVDGQVVGVIFVLR